MNKDKTKSLYIFADRMIFKISKKSNYFRKASKIEIDAYTYNVV